MENTPQESHVLNLGAHLIENDPTDDPTNILLPPDVFKSLVQSPSKKRKVFTSNKYKRDIVLKNKKKKVTNPSKQQTISKYLEKLQSK